MGESAPALSPPGDEAAEEGVAELVAHAVGGEHGLVEERAPAEPTPPPSMPTATSSAMVSARRPAPAGGGGQRLLADRDAARGRAHRGAAAAQADRGGRAEAGGDGLHQGEGEVAGHLLVAVAAALEGGVHAHAGDAGAERDEHGDPDRGGGAAGERGGDDGGGEHDRGGDRARDAVGGGLEVARGEAGADHVRG
jgi:hypothetical protein